MDTKLIRRRIAAISRKLRKDSFDAILLTSKANVTYTTGFLGDDSWALVAGSKVWLITDSRYIEDAQQQCQSCDIINRTAGLVDEVVKLAANLKKVKRLACDSSIGACEFELLKKKLSRVAKVKLSLASESIIQTRIVKDSYEVDEIKRAAKISKKAINRAIDELRIGITESELAGNIEYQMRKLGCCASFDTVVAFGANASKPHHRASMRKLKKNDTILIDYGARRNGYCSDMTRCFAVGNVSAEYLSAYKAVMLAQRAAISKVRAGVRACDVDAAAREEIEKANFPQYGHGTGHGLGLEVHESPVVSARNNKKLKVGEIITIEPGIYIPGKFGIRIEDDILVTKDGAVILTRSKKSPLLEMLEL